MPIRIPGLMKSRPARSAIVAAIAIEAAVIAAVYLVERAGLARDANAVGNGVGTPSSAAWWRVEGPGILRPGTVPAVVAAIGDDEEVLGVIVDGRARAYRLRAFSDPSSHIVNDVIDGRPITVAYCNLSDCARAYSGPPGGPPLDVRQAGLQDGQMIVKAAGSYFRHRDGRPFETGDAGAAFPYPDYPLRRRRWGEWRREYPDTDLYLAPPPREAATVDGR